MSYLAGHGFEPIGTDVSAGADVVGSMVDMSFVNDKLSRLDFEAIVHLAGIADIKKTIEDPYSCYQVNCFGTLNALELASKKKVKRFHYASACQRLRGAEEQPRDRGERDRPEGTVRLLEGRRREPRHELLQDQRRARRDDPGVAPLRGVRPSLEGRPVLHQEVPQERAGRALQLREGRDGALPHAELRQAGRQDPRKGRGGRAGVQLRRSRDALDKGAGREGQAPDGSKSELQMLPPRSPAEAEPQVSYPSTPTTGGSRASRWRRPIAGP